MADRCSSCKAPVRWAITPTGNAMILNRDPAPEGRWQLAEARVRGGTPRAVYVADERRRAQLVGELYVAHWATCPNAEEHRRR